MTACSIALLLTSLEGYSDWASYDEWLPPNVKGMYNKLTT